MVLRGPGGRRAGFVIWERSARQASLRCNLDGLRPEAELRFFWITKGDGSLLEGDTLRADAAGAVRHTLQMAGDAPPDAVVFARDDGSLYAHAFARDAPTELSSAPGRLQALLPPKENKEENKPEAASELASESGPERLDALWSAGPWPPPPGLPGARWRGGHWGYPS